MGKILISKAFNPSISAGFGPLGAYKMNKKELIIAHPKVPAPTTRKANLFQDLLR